MTGSIFAAKELTDAQRAEAHWFGERGERFVALLVDGSLTGFPSRCMIDAYRARYASRVQGCYRTTAAGRISAI